MNSAVQARASKERLLDDAALQGFIRDGHLTIRSELPREFHERMLDALEDLDEGGPRGHNNLLPCVPELAHMLDEPVIRGALRSILGTGYYLHFHRHDHFAFLNAAQPLHKDGDNHSHYAVDGLRRMHRTRYAMLFYYPQDTPLEKGPTGIVPGSQYVPRRALEAARAKLNELNKQAREEAKAKFGDDVLGSEEARRFHRKRLERFRKDNPVMFADMAKLDEPWEATKIPLTGEAGTVTITHFDIVHGRHSANVTDEPRHMVKFLFTRDRDPVAPSWQHAGGPWPEDDAPLAPAWRSMWDWHRGMAPSGDKCVGARELASDDDRIALGTAYSLGMAAARGAPGLDALLDAFHTGDVPLRTIAAYGLVAAGNAAVPHLAEMADGSDADETVRALDVLGDIGAPAAAALPTLHRATEHEHPNVRRYAVEAIGTVAQGHRFDAAALLNPLQDEDALVRRNAATAAARLAQDMTNGDLLVGQLTENLYFWHHHVRGWAIEALGRLGTPAASQAALKYLMATRWDPTPKSGDTPPDARAPRRTVRESARSRR
ncbi:MAG: HEAT repeat domain-containing protein [Gammaproteobacteria bacterium]|nr:HEAT repeat domain-containing protein [Gammaproteobacteria bacterium]